MFIQTTDHPVVMKVFPTGTNVTGRNMFHPCFTNNFNQLYKHTSPIFSQLANSSEYCAHCSLHWVKCNNFVPLNLLISSNLWPIHSLNLQLLKLALIKWFQNQAIVMNYSLSFYNQLSSTLFMHYLNFRYCTDMILQHLFNLVIISNIKSRKLLLL